MKFALVLAAVLGLALAAPKAPRDVASDIGQFVDLIPIDEIEVLFLDLLQTDADFAASVEFVRSDRFRELAAELDLLPEFKGFFDFLESKGVPGYMWMNSIRAVLNLPPFPGTPLAGGHLKPKNIAPFIEQILALLPVDDILALYDDLMQNSQDFRDLIALSISPEYLAVRAALVDSAVYTAIDNELIANGIDIGAALARIVEFFTEAAGGINKH